MPGGSEQKRTEPDVVDSDSDSDDMFDYGKKYKKAMAALGRYTLVVLYH